TLCTPGFPDAALRGGFYAFELENRGAAARTVEVALDGTWRWTLRTVVDPQPPAAENRLARSRLFPGLALEVAAGAAGAALAVAAGARQASYRVARDDAPAGQWQELPEGATLAAANGRPLRFGVAQTVSVPARGRATLTFYFGVAPEREGALATAAHLRRAGAERLLRETRLD